MNWQFKILKFSVVTMVLLSFRPSFAHKGKPTFVLEEFSKLTDRIELEKDGIVVTETLEKLLEKGGEKERDSEVFIKALPIVRELGKTTNSKTKQKFYSELVILLQRVIGYHDRSGAVLYHCPETGKQWITNSERVINPFDRKNTTCIRKKEE
ncbi:hypothetical protein EHQ12_01515 [Leptospira gomenensis]|uniref:DUF3347 domain-containing protein n=1 Tax=Leptospira gomenensis TaxID=2484974 RepID=A0A5F1YRP2_9LEPT|nr:hypothetical protein [Leptospira gomenensis]TGK36027.1 hypothetical protein EHQ17_05480 [Leptospira gomenensis]TGK44441.1 hypothetical protein EHQ12_01515 [Leptospira gomenensis]TGK53370.1 hypothetical protein EHQ07_00250 [Leptospira gomenensis]TGK60696.1 hypothetical protein EHQ13_10810 [Leptospira gomenensis]